MWREIALRGEKVDLFVREAKDEDREELWGLFAEVDALHREALPHVFREPDRPARLQESTSGLIADENAALFVAESDSRLIGVIHLCVLETPDIPVLVPRRYTVINDLVVREEFRRSGVGQPLVERAHQWALDRGATEIELTVWEFNKGALAFYEKIGYRTTSRRMWKSLR